MKTLQEILAETKELGVMFQLSISDCDEKIKHCKNAKMKFFAQKQIFAHRKVFDDLCRTMQVVKDANRFLPEYVKTQIKEILGVGDNELDVFYRTALLQVNNNVKASISHIEILRNALDHEEVKNAG